MSLWKKLFGGPKRSTEENNEKEPNELPEEEKDIKKRILLEVQRQQPGAERRITVTVVKDNPWKRYNCKFDVGSITTHWQFLPFCNDESDLEYQIDRLVWNCLTSLKMKGFE